ncbi:hypothetical protein I79_026020 [Cricetulus griseus]|uniref:Secreted protein n=1 Tax=Cricetulus griseus TaxID=10029 RepID=G3IPU2_CRIGR|nr:hypothetical protein I79_026020 [Cricetulus griseus]
MAIVPGPRLSSPQSFPWLLASAVMSLCLGWLHREPVDCGGGSANPKLRACFDTAGSKAESKSPERQLLHSVLGCPPHT